MDNFKRNNVNGNGNGNGILRMNGWRVNCQEKDQMCNTKKNFSRKITNILNEFLFILHCAFN